MGPFCNASKRGSQGQLFGRNSSSARCSNISITSEVVWAASNNFTSPEITEFVRDRAYLSPPFLLNGILCGSWRLEADTLVKSPVRRTSFLDMAFHSEASPSSRTRKLNQLPFHSGNCQILIMESQQRGSRIPSCAETFPSPCIRAFAPTTPAHCEYTLNIWRGCKAWLGCGGKPSKSSLETIQTQERIGKLIVLRDVISLKSITINQNKKTRSVALQLQQLSDFKVGIANIRFQNSILMHKHSLLHA